MNIHEFFEFEQFYHINVHGFDNSMFNQLVICKTHIYMKYLTNIKIFIYNILSTY